MGWWGGVGVVPVGWYRMGESSQPIYGTSKTVRQVKNVVWCVPVKQTGGGTWKVKTTAYGVPNVVAGRITGGSSVQGHHRLGGTMPARQRGEPPFNSQRWGGKCSRGSQ